MTYLNDIGFVVKRVNLGEADRFVTLFTKNYGKVEVLAKGVRKITSRRSSHIELLNLIRFHSLKTSKNFILTEIELVNSFEERKNTLKQCEIAFLVCELVDNLCPFGQVNKELFTHVFEFLSKGEHSEEALLGFEMKTLTHLGYWDVENKFATEIESRSYIESLIERKLKSRVIGNLS
ncbi:MAG: DNA repair protein RecO [Candidatus Levybacteria bacterium]|nr:DNA repair protein RecO [Candidatus Levybacteria bacterium]